MKILHTSDWHVGKVLKGQSRAEEHAAVLAEIVEIARAEQPDLVLVAGDLFDTTVPAPAATELVTRALTGLRGTGAEVVASANTGCTMQMAAGLRELGSPMRVLHPVEILDLAYAAEPSEAAPAASLRLPQVPSA